jgi:hypothetical protein
MSLGVHFALTAPQLQALRAAQGEEQVVLEWVRELEEAWDESALCESSKAWEPLHRVLADGGVLELAVLGGRRLLPAGRGYTAVLVPPDDVRSVAAGLLALTEPWFHERVRTLGLAGYAEDEGERRWLWKQLCALRDFYVRTAEQQRAVLFTADG